MTRIIETIFEGIVEIAVVRADLPLSAETDFERDLGFDSGNFIELFLFLEERVPGFTLGASRLQPEHFHTVAGLAGFIETRLATAEEAA